MRKILPFILIFSLFIPGLPGHAQTDEGYGEDQDALGQFVDSFENANNISVIDDLIVNSTLDCVELNVSSASPAYENFTTYTEVDGGGDLEVYDYNVTVTSMRRDAVDWVAYDFGVDALDEVNHNLTFKVTDVEAGDSTDRFSVSLYALGQIAGTYIDLFTEGDELGVAIDQVGSTDDKYNMAIFWYDGGVLQGVVDGMQRNAGTELYLNIDYSSDDFILRVYTDEAHTALSETLSLLNKVDTAYRFINVVSSEDSAGDGADHWSGYVKNLWIGNYTGGYENDGYFTTDDYMNDTVCNGTSLVLMVNSTVPANTMLQVQFSDDNATWGDHEGTPLDADVLSGGFESIDLRELNYTDVYLMYNFSTSDALITPRLYQSRLITTIGNASTGAGVTINELNGTWIDYNLTEIGVTVGTLDSGNLASTNFIDGDMFNVSEVVGAPGIQISANVTGIDDNAIALWITIYSWYGGNLNHDFDVEVWDFTNTVWVEDSHIEDGVALEWVNSTIYGLRIPIDFLNAGELRIRLDHEAAGNINHDYFIEYFRVQAFVPTGLAVGGVGNGAIGFIMLGLISIPVIVFMVVKKR